MTSEISQPYCSTPSPQSLEVGLKAISEKFDILHIISFDRVAYLSLSSLQIITSQN